MSTHDLFQFFCSVSAIRESCLHDVWRPVPMHLVRLHRLHFLLLHGLYPTLVGSGLALASGWGCTAGRVVAPTLFCEGGCAYTRNQALPRDQMSLFLGPSEPKGISLVWLCAQTEGWRGEQHSPHSETTHTPKRQRHKPRVVRRFK